MSSWLPAHSISGCWPPVPSHMPVRCHWQTLANVQGQLLLHDVFAVDRNDGQTDEQMEIGSLIIRPTRFPNAHGVVGDEFSFET
uniref:Uncharacterized protein n=1 Tax=Romanomermis culicivorax TaxID=13658 RepID=A0A915IFV2_ROMCU